MGVTILTYYNMEYRSGVCSIRSVYTVYSPDGLCIVVGLWMKHCLERVALLNIGVVGACY